MAATFCFRSTASSRIRSCSPLGFDDVIFAQVLRWRLGCQSVGAPTTCCNQSLEGEMCGEPLGLPCHHEASCPVGPARNQRHNALADELATCIAETGAHVRREAWIMEFTTPAAEAKAVAESPA